MFGNVLDVLLAKLVNVKMLCETDYVVALDVVGDHDDSLLVLEYLVQLDDLLDPSASIESSDLSLDVD